MSPVRSALRKATDTLGLTVPHAPSPGAVTLVGPSPITEEPDSPTKIPILPAARDLPRSSQEGDEPVPAEPAETDPAGGAATPTEVAAKTTGGFRMRGLDGLRALAAGAVLFYHFLPGVLPGGFLGVDVFFVLSGFLITGLLVEERARTGRIALTQFWWRRFRRLLPAVTTLILVTVPLAALVSRDLLVGIARQVGGALAFVYNWVTIAEGASYFNQHNPRLYLNVWSLGVEEQFYLVWPLLIVGAFAVTKGAPPRRLATLSWALAALSAGVMAVYVHGLPATGAGLDVTRAYMGTDSHSFGLMLGAGLALALSRPMAPARRILPREVTLRRGWLAWGGLALALSTFVWVPDSQAWTYPWGTLVAAGGIVAYLQGCTDEVAGVPGPARVLVRVVDAKPLRWLGQRSYGIYLWHWPIIVLLEVAAPRLAHPVTALVATILSIGAAAASYRWIEEPIRRDGFRAWFERFLPAPSRPVVPGRLVGAGVAGVLVIATLAALALAPEKTQIQAQLEQEANRAPQPAPTAVTPTPSPTPTPTPVRGQEVTVIGDSVTLGAKSALEAALPGAVVDGEVSRSILRAVALVQHYAAQIGQRPYLVVALATNSAISDKQIDDLMGTVAPTTKVVLVEGYGPARCTWIPPSNQVLRAAVERYPGRIAVARWHEAISAHPEWLGPDATHPVTPEAEQLYAQTIVDALTEVQADALAAAPGGSQGH